MSSIWYVHTWSDAYSWPVSQEKSRSRHGGNSALRSQGADHPSTKDVRSVLSEIEDKLLAFNGEGSGEDSALPSEPATPMPDDGEANAESKESKTEDDGGD